MKIALIHDYLREYGGAERVLEALHELYPDAPLYTSFVDQQNLGIHWQRFATWKIHQSWMTKIPFYQKIYSPLRVIADMFFEQFDLSEYDLVISSSNMYFAKAVITKSWTPHICYCHTPPRPLYGYSTMSDWKKNPIIRLGGEIINKIIRPKDFLTAQRVDYFLANSKEVQKRIKKFYHRDSTVIYPPVDVPQHFKDEQKREYFLYVNRLGFSKHPELAIQACTELNLPLKVVGTGRMEQHLKEIAGKNVDFLGFVSDQKLHELYAGAKALLYPVEDEDFGIVPVEAMGYGVPVIAHRSGGPLETIVENESGLFVDELNTKTMINAIKEFENTKWDRKKIYQHALKFRKERFMKEVKEFIDGVLKTNRNK